VDKGSSGHGNLISASLLVVSRWPWQGPLWCLRVQLAQRFVGRIFLVDQSWGKVQVNSGARRAVVWPAWPPAAAPAEVGETISSFVRRLIASAVTRLKSGERTLCGFTRKMDAGRMNSSFLFGKGRGGVDERVASRPQGAATRRHRDA
jgi:hypothetical protein